MAALRLNSTSTAVLRALSKGGVSATTSTKLGATLASRSYFAGSQRPDGSQPPDTRHAQRTHPGTIRHAVINPAEKALPFSDNLHKYGKYLISCLPKHIQQFTVWKDELTIHIAPTSVVPVFTFLKNHTAAQFTTVSDICGVDYPTRPYRFEVVYNMLSVRHNARIRVKTYADETTPVPSVTFLYDGANWFEREAYDMYGIFFTDHPDLRRILTDYGFDGHPLRKDFPLTGYTEIRYDEEKKRVVVEPLEMTQAFRNFQGGSSVWEPVGEGRDMRPEEFKLPKPEPEEKKEEPKK